MAPPRDAEPPAELPQRALRTADVVLLVLGLVVGVGIFRAPADVAAHLGGDSVVLAWVAGGAVSLAGAFCYAELSSAYPHAGGDYHFLGRAFGRATAFLFGWARLTVIPTGSVALLGFAFGDYVAAALGRPEASGVSAATLVLALTALNAAGLRPARKVQHLLTALLVVGIAAVIGVGLLGPPAAVPAPDGAGRAGSTGLAMVFVLLAYGGWNEVAYASAEVRGGRRALGRGLVLGVGAVTALYVVANLAYLRGLTWVGLAASPAAAADLLGRAFGPSAAVAITAVVAAASITSAHATLLMGSRMAWAFGREHALFERLGRWNGRVDAPVNAVLAQGGVALALVVVGAASRTGFEAMVAYTAPVFWAFFALTGFAVFRLRWCDPGAPRAFPVPLYPLTPAVFCAACLYLLYSSLAYAGPGSLAGIAVLLAGLVPLWLSNRAGRTPVRRAAGAAP